MLDTCEKICYTGFAERRKGVVNMKVVVNDRYDLRDVMTSMKNNPSAVVILSGRTYQPIAIYNRDSGFKSATYWLTKNGHHTTRLMLLHQRVEWRKLVLGL